ncbi:zinc-binding alcohol dehydrogenase [Aeromicrobium flavum]|uniref:Zinc-binding alcohol dehydrogenase n=1 Tax=Aeromicrobium flavum TaxID=416568 RepID=A0A512HUR0_9ACTN|nr:NADP-dependent oxidoreductase [Aeromicrobium flavum]GEO89192.1 zinc-binding alcohol dehydrogenase [Aeromicrobium flavum]
MRAIGANQYGGPDVLEVVELPDPVPGPGEVLVRVHAAAVNPTDTYVRNGDRARAQAKQSQPPYVPGMDVAGVLEAIGPDVRTDLAVGDRVMGVVIPHGRHGAYSELVALPVGSVAAAPAGTSHAEASTLPMNGLTARLALDLVGLEPGQVLGVTGAAGALGGYVIELAKADGLVVVADASEADEPLVRKLGADIVVPRGDGVAELMLQEVPDGVHAMVDGSVQDAALFPAIRDGGAFAAVRCFRGEPPRGIRNEQVWITAYAQEQERLDTLRRQAETGVLTLRVADRLPAAQAAEAHRRLEAGGVRGRLVLEF